MQKLKLVSNNFKFRCKSFSLLTNKNQGGVDKSSLGTSTENELSKMVPQNLGIGVSKLSKGPPDDSPIHEHNKVLSSEETLPNEKFKKVEQQQNTSEKK